jgi:hypothetical protein
MTDQQDRRKGADRRTHGIRKGDRRVRDVPVSVERRSGKDRRVGDRRSGRDRRHHETS